MSAVAADRPRPAMGRKLSEAAVSAYLLAETRGFLAHLGEITAAITASTASTDTAAPAAATASASPPPAAADAAEAAAAPVVAQLTDGLDARAADARRRWGEEFATSTFRPVQVAFATLADQELGQLTWAGAPALAERPLTVRLYGIDDGPAAVFDQVALVLTGSEAHASGLAATYLMLTCVGLEAPGGAAATDGWRRRLAHFLETLEPRLLADLSRLFPEAYLFTASRGHGELLPAVRAWSVGLAVVVVLLLLASIPVFRDAVAELSREIEAVLQLR